VPPLRFPTRVSDSSIPGVSSAVADVSQMIVCGQVEAFAGELPTLRPPPDEPFGRGLLLGTRVDLRARVSVRQCYYSVPARLRAAGDREDTNEWWQRIDDWVAGARS
jgi:hypothetical protein